MPQLESTLLDFASKANPSLWGKLFAWVLPSALAVGAAWFFLLPQSFLLGFSVGLGEELGLGEEKERLAFSFLILTAALARGALLMRICSMRQLLELRTNNTRSPVQMLER